MRALPPVAVASLSVLLPAVLVFALACDNGGYSVESRGSWAIGTWWVLALGVVLGWWPSRERSRAGTAVVVMLAAFALLTLASALWSTNDADAFSEFNRVGFYFGGFVLVLQAAHRAPLHRVADGIALGLTAVVALALFSRITPEVVSEPGLAEALPVGTTRLSYPIGYWNGLAILTALSLPLLLRAAASPGHSIPRALAAAPLPAAAATIYLASSRGGIATATIGTAVYLALSRFRWRVVSALVAGGIGSALVLAVLVSHSEFVNEPAAASTSTRVSIALVLLLGCVVSFALHATFATVLARVPAPPRWVGMTAVAAALVVSVTAIAYADPVEQLRTFKQPPTEAAANDDAVLAHLASLGGSGRWQFWETALDAWHAMPVLGHGAGSYEAWWAQHGTLPVFVRDAHSLYLETLAELGALGLALLAAAAAAVLLASWWRIRRLSVARADTVASATAVVIAYAVAAGIDWVWELPVVTLVALACLAVALTPTRIASRGPGALVRAGFAGIAIVMIVGQAIPYLSQVRIRESQSAAASRQFSAALDSARAARNIQPWGPDPWLQLALVHEERGELELARTAIDRATREDRDDWRLWLVAARVETKLGDIADARRSLERAIQLNPRSPLLQNLR
jgi:tetratricopeptide (TPR) repeat protein